MKRKCILGFFVSMAILITACKAPVSDEPKKVQIEESEQPTNENIQEPKDFSMPQKEELGGANFDHVALAAKEMGYEFEPVKEFSNGYKFSWLTVGNSNDITIMYKKDGIKVNLLIMPPGETYPYEENEIRDSHLEIGGIDIRKNHYIHFEMPANWEEIITEEQQALLDSGAAGGGVDSASTEIIRHDSYKFIWQQGNTEFCLSNDVMNDVSEEDLELMVTEWLKR